MSAPAENAWAIKARLQKVHKVVDYIDCRACEEKLNPHAKDFAESVVQQLVLAREEQWEDLERKAKVNPLSLSSRELLIAIYRDRAKKAETVDDVIDELREAHVEYLHDVKAGVAR